VPQYSSALGQNRKRIGKTEQTISAIKSPTPKSKFINLTKEYKLTLEKMLDFHSDQEKKAAEVEEQKQRLYKHGFITKAEFEESMRARLDEKLKVVGLKSQLEEIDSIIAEAEAIYSFGTSRIRGNSATGVLIRFSGLNNWGLQDAGKIENFFMQRFGRQLPISAFGQTAVHNRLGFAHYNAMDVALSPDSFEGQALMTYLRSENIPFLGFRQAVPGSATGAHIHVGKTSSRF